MSLAMRLEGKTIGKWRVIEKRIKTADDRSGAFSSCYKVEHTENGQPAFLKAINFKYAFDQIGRGVNFVDFIRDMTALYTYERDLSLFCQGRRMNRVVTAIDHGEYSEASEPYPVPYLIFDIADGSLKTVNSVSNTDIAWKLTAFHGCLVGLSQLHSNQIVHQDIKPSNILIFGQNVSRLADLGNATRKDKPSPRWDTDEHCGDWNYAPIELLYGYCSPDWTARRLGADLFMAGSILVFLLSGMNMLGLMLSFIPDVYNHLKWGGTFEQIKPVLMDAYHKSLAKVSQDFPSKIKADVTEVIAQLCHPIPEERGNPQNICTSVTRYSLQRYISIVDRLAKTMELQKHIIRK
jgi:serine/threonine protein kinase